MSTSVKRSSFLLLNSFESQRFSFSPVENSRQPLLLFLILGIDASSPKFQCFLAWRKPIRD